MRIGITKKIFPRPVFEAILKKHLPQNDVNLVMLAYRIAKYGHKNQKRDDLSRYFDHVKFTALIIMIELKIFVPRILITALLHDIREKSFILKFWDIEFIFGKRVAKAIETLTKKRGKDYFQGLAIAIWWVKLVKMADRLHNLRTLDNRSRAKKIKCLEETKTFYFPLTEQLFNEVPVNLREKVLYLIEEMKWACQRAERTIK